MELAILGKSLVKLIVAVLLALAVYMLIKKYILNESMEVVSMNSDQLQMDSNIGLGTTMMSSMSSMESGAEQQLQEDPLKVQSYEEDRPFSGAKLDASYNSMSNGHGDIVPMDLLPNNDAAAVFAAENPQGNVQDVNYLTAGFNIGIDSRGGVMKNPSLDIRGDIPIPKAYVGPWGQSTYEPDLYKKLC